MINFTAVMRSPGFCGGWVQTRNVNYCMAPGLWEPGPLSANQRPGMGPGTNERPRIVHGKMGTEQSGLTGGNHVSSAYCLHLLPNSQPLKLQFPSKINSSKISHITTFGSHMLTE